MLSSLALHQLITVLSSLPPPRTHVFTVDCEKSGMADMVFEMIQDADIDTRAEYYKHIVLSGTHSAL
jgi:actin-related protein